MYKYIIKLNLIVCCCCFCSVMNALDISKIDSKDFVGGNPYKSSERLGNPKKNSSSPQKAKSSEESYRGSASEKQLDDQIRKYRSNQKGILQIYRSNQQERQIDKQIQQYRPYAKKNAETFGEDAKLEPNFDRNENLHEIQKITPSSQSRDRVPEYRTKPGIKPPQAPLNPLFSKPPSR